MSGVIGTEGWIENNGTHLSLVSMSIVDRSTYTAQPWGIYRLTDYEEFSNPSSETTWTAKVGGQGEFGAYTYTSGEYTYLYGDWGYWLADITDGQLTSGKLTGALSGRFITHTRMGDVSTDTGMAGDLLGTYNTTDNTWQAVSLGTWSGTDLSFVNNVSANLNATTRYYDGSYSYPNGGSYSFNYYTDNRTGSVTYSRPTENIYYSITYNSNGTYSGWDYMANDDAGGAISGRWNDTHTSLSFLGTPLDSGNATLSTSNNYALNYHDGSSISGLMGGTESIWDATDTALADITMIGKYTAGTSRAQHLWNTAISSYNYKDGEQPNTTYTGGAYRGYLAGIQDGSTMEGRILGLYIDPSGNAGYLKGDVAGTIHPEIGMFEMAGGMYPLEPVITGTDLGISANDLNSNVYDTPDGGTKRLAGSFTDAAGQLWTDRLTMNTMSIVNYTTGEMQPWGIYRQELAGRYTDITGTDWTGKAGGDSYIGAYLPYWWYGSDYGYWLGDAGGAWSNDRIDGALTNGRYLTYTRLGQLQGELFGSYNTTDNTWQAVGLGAWSGQDLKFVNTASANLDATTRYYDGLYTYSDNGSYSFNYYTDNRSGSVNYYRPAENIYYSITYNSDGTYSGWDYAASSPLSGRWDGTHTDLSFLGTPLDSGAALSSSNNYALNYGDGSGISGLMGGTESIWDATDTALADITMIGKYTAGTSRAQHLWGTTIASYNYKDDTSTTYTGGAYRGYLAGIQDGGAMEGRILGLYIDPDGNAGYLKGGIAGTIHPEIGMFEMAGGMYPLEPVISAADLVISANDLNSNIHETYDTGTKRLAGGFTDAAGQLWTDGLTMNTMSIVNYPAGEMQPWGIYRQELTGRYTGPTGNNWTGKIGGDSLIGAYLPYWWGYDYGYWLGDAGGAWSNDRIDGALTNGRFLTYTRLGQLQGDLFGSYNTTDNTWQAVGLGTWSGQDLKFVNTVGAYLNATTRYYGGSYTYPGYGSYSFNYYTDNHYGSVTYYRPAENIYYSITYNSDGTYTKTDYTTSPYTYTTGRWDTGHTDLTFLGTPLDSGAALSSSNNYALNYHDGSSISGLMGGTESIWDATDTALADITMIGKYTAGTSRAQHLWSTTIASSNYRDGTGTTYTGGAYRGYLAGIQDGSTVEGRILAFYIDPEGNAGYLKGQVGACTIHPEIGMYEMAGGIYPLAPEISAADLGISASDLGGIYETPDTGTKQLAGSFTEQTGRLWTDGLTMNTMSLVNSSTGEILPWGLYRQELVGRYTGTTAAEWTGKVGGDSCIGAYTPWWSWWWEDYGYWLGDVAGTWDAGRIEGALTNGRFITYTRLGQLQGDLFGSYNTTDNTWQAVSLGTWSGTPLAFGGRVAGYDSGNNIIFEGLMGGVLASGVDDLWGATVATPAEIFSIGEYKGLGTLPPVLALNIQSYNPYDGTCTILDQVDYSQNGAYNGYLGVRTIGETPEGNILALYLDKSGNAGILKGSFDGSLYPALEMMEGSGSIYPIELVHSTGYNGVNLYPGEGGLIFKMEYQSQVEGGPHGYFFDNGISSGTISWRSVHSTSASIGGVKNYLPWSIGVGSVVSSGIYDGITSDYWALGFGQSTTDPAFAQQGYYLSSADAPGKWSDGMISGKGVSVWVSWDAGMTGVFGAELKGTYDPAHNTWQAVGMGASVDTIVNVLSKLT